jgi:hypothetical protein
MSVSGISFWQQDQAWRTARQAQDQQLSFTASLSSTMISALSNQTTGLAGIANQRALTRVNSQIATLQGNSNSNASDASSGGSSTSTPTSTPSPSPPVSSATNLSSSVTAAALLAGQLPSGSLLSILA